MSLCLLAIGCIEPPKAKLRLAVATNFRPALEILRVDFERDCACELEISSAATGLLYSQIREGAPFDVFLAADAERPLLLQRDQLIVPGSRQAYARGRLALWASNVRRADTKKSLPGFVPTAQAGSEISQQQLRTLFRAWKEKIVIADPQLAPYGNAAVELLRHLKLWRSLRGQMVYAANVAHAQILLREGHAQLGLIPLSLAQAGGGEYMAIPAELHSPLEQQLVVLKNSRVHPLAERFTAYLLSPQVQSRLGEMGYLPGAEQ
jgi:molybdenum ABC transporter molybdate-binding protein